MGLFSVVERSAVKVKPLSWLRSARALLLVTLSFSVIVAVTAAPVDIAKGVAWLQTQIQSTGSLLMESQSATQPQAQCETAVTLLQLVGKNAQLASLMGALQANDRASSATESLACIQLLKQRLGHLTSSADMAERSAPNGGYAAYTGFTPGNALDTGWTLETALRNLPSSEQDQLLVWLQSQQGNDGSFKLNGNADVLSTAVVLRGLKEAASLKPVAALVAKKAATYLLAKRDAQSRWLGDVAATAVVFEAVHPYSGSDGAVGNAVSAYLLGQQQADGSWQADPYVTAVVLRALSLAATPPKDPTVAASVATLQGQALEGGTNTPLAGVKVNVWSAGLQVASTVADGQGRYILAGLPTGLLNVVASLANYQTVTGTITLAAQDAALFSPAMFALAQTPVPISVGQTTLTGAQIFGKATNAQNNTPLAGVSVSLQTPGSATVTVTTANDGGFDARVAAGEVTITYVLSGFVTQTQRAVVSDGAVVNAGTIAMKAKVSGAQIFGKVTNAQSNAALMGVSVSLQAQGTSTVVLTTGSDGGFDTRVTAGEVTITYVLSGFSSQTQHAIVSDGTVLNAGTIAMRAKQARSTMRGLVSDQTGLAIAGATVTVIGQTATSVSNAAGSYQLNDLTGVQWSVRVSAPNHASSTYQVTVAEPTDVQQNFTLVAQSVAGPAASVGYVLFSDFAVSRFTASANTEVTASAAVTNPSAVTASTAIGLEVRNAQGATVANLSAFNAQGLPFPPSTFAPGETISIQYKWNTAAFAAGYYTLMAKLIIPGSANISNPNGTVTDSRFQAVSVLESPQFSGAVTANPPVLRAGGTTPIRLSALVQNTGNTVLPAQTYQLSVVDTVSGRSSYTQSVTGEQLLLSKLLPLQFADWANPVAGSYRIELTSPSVPGSTVTTSLFIGDAATASFALDRPIVPTGTQKVRGMIKVNGVDVATGAISDPLSPLVKSAVVKSVNFVDNYVYNHYVSDLKCFACHVQSQAVVGGERNLRFAPPLNPLKRSALMDTLTRYVRENGSILHEDGYYATTNTSLGLWAAKEWHDQKSVALTTRKMADYLITQQPANGSWNVDYANLWWANPTPFTALNMMSFVDLKSSVAVNGSPTTPVIRPSGILGLPSEAAMRFAVNNEGRLFIAAYFSRQIWTVPPGGTTATLLVNDVSVTSIRTLNDGGILYSGADGIFKRASDGTTVKLSSIFAWDAQPYGENEYLISPNQQGKSAILGANGQLRDYFVSSVLSGFLTAQVQLPDGSILGNSYYGAKIVRFKDGQLLDIPVPLTNSNPIDLLKVGDDFLLSTENGLYKYSKEWVGERLTFERTYSMVKMPDGRILANLRSGLFEVALDEVDRSAYVQRLDTAIQKSGNWLVAGSGIDTNNNIDVAFRLMGLGKLKQYYIGTPRYNEFDALMQQLGTLLQSRQRPDGGWVWKQGQYAISDSMVTAMVGLGLDTLNPSKDDPIYRKTIVYLLGTQQADGSWPSQNGVAATKAATSTWVEIYLPTLLDRLGGIDTDLNVKFAPNTIMSNPSLSPTSVVTFADGSVQAKWRLIGVTNAGRQVDFDLTVPDMQIDEVRPAAQQTWLEFRNSFVDGTVTAQIPIPDIRATSNAAVAVTTDKSVYNEVDIASFSAPVTNNGSFVREAQVRLSVLDATGQVVEVLPLGSPITVAAGASVPVVRPWSVASVLAGNYLVKAELVTPQGGVYGSATASFAVQASQAQANTARISTDRLSYSAAQAVQLTSRVGNATSNTVQNDVRAVTEVFNAAGTSVYSRSEPIAQLSPASLRSYNYSLAASGLAAGIYQAHIQLLSPSGSVLAQSTSSFAVLASDLTGVGLQGTLSASPKEVALGENVALGFSVSNSGNSTLTNVPLQVRVVDPETGALVAQFAYTSTLSIGAHYASAANWVAAGTLGRQYVAVLSAVIGGNTATLAQDSFILQGAPIKLDIVQTLPGNARVLVLVSCKYYDEGKYERDDDERSGSKPEEEHDEDEDHSKTCNAQRANTIQQALTSLGVSHTVVTNTSEFKRLFRSGLYNTYWISGKQYKLHDELASEIREAVFAGDSLILDGVHDERNKVLDTVAGITYKGKLSDKALMVNTTGPLFAPQQLAVVGNGLKLLANGGQPVASFAGPGKYATGPAVFTHSYGLGRSIMFGFDLVTSLRAQPLWQPVLGTGLHYVLPAQGTGTSGTGTSSITTLTPGALLPIQTSVTNQGPATGVQVKMSLPAGSVAAGSSPTAVLDATGRSASWAFNLALEQSQDLFLSLRAPAVAGDFAVLTHISTVNTTTNTATSSTTPYGQPLTLSFKVSAAAQIALDVRAALLALPLSSSKDQKLRTYLLADLAKTMALFNQNSAKGYEDAIKALIELIDDLAGLSEGNTPVNTQAVHLGLDRILKEAQWRWSLLPTSSKSR